MYNVSLTISNNVSMRNPASMASMITMKPDLVSCESVQAQACCIVAMFLPPDRDIHLLATEICIICSL
jgi:hypothetical protein